MGNNNSYRLLIIRQLLFIDSAANTTGDMTGVDRKVIVAHFLTAHTL